MSVFDHLHEQFFDQLFNLDDASRHELAKAARQCGASESDVQAILANPIRRGTTFGAAHPIDVKLLVERALFRHGAQSISLKISRWPHDEVGHLDIQVLAVEQAPAGK